MENIVKIFNSQDENEIKQAFKEIIKKQFKNDLEEMDTYMFNPNAIEEMINNSFEEIITEVKNEFKEKLKEKLFNAGKVNEIFTKIFA